MPEAKSTGKEPVHRVRASSRLMRGARSTLGLTQEELAKAAGITRETLNALESGKVVSEQTRERVQASLELRGVVFTNGGEPGFKLSEK